MNTRLIKDILYVAGPQWGERSPDDIIKALDGAGFVIMPKEPDILLGRAGADQFERSDYATPAQRMIDAYRAMVARWTDDRS